MRGQCAHVLCRVCMQLCTTQAPIGLWSVHPSMHTYARPPNTRGTPPIPLAVQYWTTAANWRAQHRSWMHDSWEGLQGEAVEREVTNAYKVGLVVAAGGWGLGDKACRGRPGKSRGRRTAAVLGPRATQRAERAANLWCRRCGCRCRCCTRRPRCSTSAARALRSAPRTARLCARRWRRSKSLCRSCRCVGGTGRAAAAAEGRTQRTGAGSAR